MVLKRLTTFFRDYRLAGPNNQLAIDKGLVTTEWYQTPISRQRMKELTKRRNGPAIRNTLLWLGLLIGSGVAGYLLWGTWWAVLAFALYGVFYTAADARWHECGHGTAFKTPWMNDVVYYLASFMYLRPATAWRWSHQRHHSDTFVAGRDPEIVRRPSVLRMFYLAFINLFTPPNEIKRIVNHAFGRLLPDERDYVPESEHRKVVWEGRIYLIIILSVMGWSLFTLDIRPMLFIITPLFYGSWIWVIYVFPQHVGLHEDVLDHRLNTRTVYMNPFIRFLYLNMNYHIEHHMFPLVPFYNLRALHEEMKHDCPTPTPNLWTAFKEVYYAFKMQTTNPYHVIERPLPPTANPYYYGPAPYLKQNPGVNEQAG
jgi:fatty acid desaturase